MVIQDFKSTLELINTFSDEESCIAHLEKLRWNNYVISPFDSTSKVYKTKNGYRCKNSSKYFNVKTGTLFDNTKVKLQKWFIAIWLVTSHKKDISSLQLAKDIDVTQKTAWFMLQRIRACFDIDDNIKLDNDLEVDETNIDGKNKSRHAQKKILHSQGKNHKDKTPVVEMLERQGKISDSVVKNVKSQKLTREIINKVKESANLYSDEWLGYRGVSRVQNHAVVKHNEGEYVGGRVHTNTIEGFGL